MHLSPGSKVRNVHPVLSADFTFQRISCSRRHIIWYTFKIHIHNVRLPESSVPFVFCLCCAIGAERKAHHCPCGEEPLWRLCLRGQQHSGSEREQSRSAVCARWEENTPPTRSEHSDSISNQSHAPVSHVSPELLLCPPAAKPVLVLKPENVSVRLGESAQFYCQAKGDPPPAVVWSREQGPLPNGRYLVIAAHRGVHFKWDYKYVIFQLSFSLCQIV